MNTKKAAVWFGIVFVLIGVLGFIPALTPNGLLLGIFAVDPLHNIIHLLSGVIALLCAGDYMKARGYFKIFGIVYALVTVIGFIQGQTVLGLITVNTADNFLHLVIAVVSLIIGFGGSSKKMAAQSM